MKLLQKIILILFFIIHPFQITYSQSSDIQQNLSNVQDVVNDGQQLLRMNFIPQYQDYSSYIPPQIKDILSKVELKDIQVGYDSTSSLGAISATTSILGTPALVRIVIGKALTTGATFQDNFKKNLIDYQNKLKTIYQAPQKGAILANKGLTYISSLKNDSKEMKQALLNEALKKEKQATIEKPEKTPTDTTAKQSWVSKQLAGYEAGIIFVLPQGFKFSSISSNLQFLDYIDFEEIILGIGAGFTDPIYGDIPQGFSLVAQINSDIEPFKTVTSFLNRIPGPAKLNLNQPFSLRGGILPGIGGSSFGFGLPGQMAFKLGNNVIAQTDQLTISLILLPLLEGTMGVSGASVGLSGGLKVFLNVVDSRLNPLDFKVALAIDSSAEAALTGIMNGMLNLEAIGLPLQFGNMTITAGINPENIETLGLAELGMAGELDFGPQDNETSLKAAINVKLSGQNTNLLIYGDLEPKGTKKDALTLKDLVYLATTAFKDLGIHLDSFDQKIPDLGINKATFYFSPRNTIFASKLWKAGAKVDLQLDILGAQAQLEANINSAGFDATGFISTVDLGPIKITGAGESKKCTLNDSCLTSCNSTDTGQDIVINKPAKFQTVTDAFNLNTATTPQALKDWTDYSKLQGPIVNIRFKPPLDIGIFISAEVDVDADKLGIFKTDACFDVSVKGVFAHFEAQIFNILDAVFTLNANNFLKPKDWYVCAKLKQNGLTLLENKIEKLVSIAKQQVTEQIQNAQDKVTSAERAYTDAFNQAQSALDSAQSKVNSLKTQLDDAKNKCSGQGGDSHYPYQKPHQFNPDYVKPKYAFLGNLIVYGSQSYTASINNKTLKFDPNTPYSLIEDFIKNTTTNKYLNILPGMAYIQSISDYLNQPNNHLVLSPGTSLSITLNPVNSQVQPIKILIRNTNNIITSYIWRKQDKIIGYKIIFDTAKFAEYVTQTFWYNDLSKGMALGFALGFAINGDNLDITDPKNTTLPLNRLFNINILEPLVGGGLKLLDLSLFPKIGEKNIKTPMSYTDLLFGSPKALDVQPLDNNDLNVLNS